MDNRTLVTKTKNIHNNRAMTMTSMMMVTLIRTMTTSKTWKQSCTSAIVIAAMLHMDFDLINSI